MKKDILQLLYIKQSITSTGSYNIFDTNMLFLFLTYEETPYFSIVWFRKMILLIQAT